MKGAGAGRGVAVCAAACADALTIAAKTVMKAGGVFMGSSLGLTRTAARILQPLSRYPGSAPTCDQERGRDNGPARLDRLGSLQVQRARLALVVGSQLIA